VTAPFDPLRLLGLLHDSGVRFVLIGGVAARLHGSPTVTRDVDICHDRAPANLELLAAVLVRLGARLRGVDDDVPFRLDAATLAAGGNFTFVTDAGDLDLLAFPAGMAGYAELAEHADALDLDGLVVEVASLGDLITMKRAAGRPKDRIEVEVLTALQAEIEER
jgi:hypothetical protein